MEAGTSDVDVPSSWWGDNWLYVAAGVTLVAGVVLSLITGTQGLGIGMLVAGTKAAISGAIVGGVIGGLSAVVTGNDSLQGLSSGAVDGLLSGFVLGSVLYAGGVAVGAMRARVPGTPEHAMRVYSRFDVDKAYVKIHHTTSTGGKQAKFIGNKAQSEMILKTAMRQKNIITYADNSAKTIGRSYKYIINAGKIVGAKGEQNIFLALTYDGGMATAFPYKVSYFLN
jgi:hypothetical protein